MKTSQITEEYGTVFIIAPRRSNFLARLELLSLYQSLPVTVQRVWLFLELKIGFKKREMDY